MTTSGDTSPARLSRIDATTRPDHFYLEPSDICLYVGDYTARQRFSYSDTNQLVLNFKMKMSVRTQNPNRWPHKFRAIQRVASTFKRLLPATELQKYTLVPMPPSKAIGDPLYDDRMVQVVWIVAAGSPIDARPIVRLTQSLVPSHDSESRPTPDDLAAVMEIDQKFADPQPKAILIFDDVLVAGAHFKAAQRVLQERYGQIPVHGLFIARRVVDAIPPDDDAE